MKLREASGYSLVEAAVATALVVTVLIPLGGSLLYLLTAKQNEPYLAALNIGQQVMERTLGEQRYVSRHLRLADGRWRVEQAATRQGHRIHIVVRVYRGGRDRPLVQLTTVRLSP